MHATPITHDHMTVANGGVLMRSLKDSMVLHAWNDEKILPAGYFSAAEVVTVTSVGYVSLETTLSVFNALHRFWPLPPESLRATNQHSGLKV